MSHFHREREQDNAWTVRVRDPRDEFAKVTVYLDSATTARISASAKALDWDEDRDALDGDPGFAVLFAIKRFLDSAPEAVEALRAFYAAPFPDEDKLANLRLAQKLAEELHGPFKPLDLSDFRQPENGLMAFGVIVFHRWSPTRAGERISEAGELIQEAEEQQQSPTD